MMRKAVDAIVIATVFVLAWQGTAFAATEVPDVTTLLELARPVYTAILSGQYWVAAAFALVLAVGLVRRLLLDRWSFLRTDVGGSVLVLVGSFGGALGTHLLAVGVTVPTLAMCWAALGIAFTAAGGYSLAKRLLQWAAGVSPGWLQPLVLIALWVFERVTGANAVPKAEAAGDKAVAENPPTGLPTPRDVL